MKLRSLCVLDDKAIGRLNIVAKSVMESSEALAFKERTAFLEKQVQGWKASRAELQRVLMAASVDALKEIGLIPLDFALEANQSLDISRDSSVLELHDDKPSPKDPMDVLLDLFTR